MNLEEEKVKKTLKDKLKLTDKGKKRLKIILSIIFIIFIIIFVNTYNYSNYKTISKHVNKDYKELENIANDYMNGKEIELPDYVEEIRLYKDNNTVEFSINGRGIATYYGFYYSKNNKEVSYQNEFDLIQIGEGKWMWSTKKGDEGKTFKIRDNFYYYEASL